MSVERLPTKDDNAGNTEGVATVAQASTEKLKKYQFIISESQSNNLDDLVYHRKRREGVETNRSDLVREALRKVYGV